LSADEEAFGGIGVLLHGKFAVCHRSNWTTHLQKDGPTEADVDS
jgi:hypothetical protein